MRKGLAIDRTICLYTDDTSVLNLVKQYTTLNNLSYFIAEDESDLVAVPYFLLIMDVNRLLTNDFIEWLVTAKKQAIAPCETIVSHTKPNTAQRDVSDLFVVKEVITEHDITVWRKKYRERE